MPEQVRVDGSTDKFFTVCVRMVVVGPKRRLTWRTIERVVAAKDEAVARMTVEAEVNADKAEAIGFERKLPWKVSSVTEVV